MIKYAFIRKLPNGKFRVLSRKNKNLGTFPTRAKAEAHLAEVEMFKHMDKKKRKSAFLSIIEMQKQSAEKEITTTYSAVLRDLRKNNPEKVMSFLKTFKDAFDRAVDDGLDDVESVALMEAKQTVDIKK